MRDAAELRAIQSDFFTRLPPLPLDCFDPDLRYVIESVASSYSIPPDGIALMALAAGSAALGGKFIAKWRSWEEPGILWMLGIGLPGEGKSHALKEISAPFHRIEAELAEAHKLTAAEAEERRNLLEVRLKALQAADKGASSPSLDLVQARAEFTDAKVPVRPRLLVSDITPESFVGTLADQGGRLAVLAAEGDPIALALGRYSADNAARIENHNKAYGHEPIIVDRQRGTIHIPRPSFSLGVLAQPAVLQSMMKSEAVGRGFLDRFGLVSLPPLTVDQRATIGEEVPSDARATWEGIVRTLKARADQVDPAEPARVLIDQEAGEAFQAFYRRMAERLTAGGDLVALGSYGSKIAGRTLRIALVLSMIGNLSPLVATCRQKVATNGKPAVSGFSASSEAACRNVATYTEERDLSYLLPLIPMAAAIRLTEDYLIPHAVDLLGLSISEEDRRARQVFEWLAKRADADSKTFERRLLQRHGPRFCRDGQRLDAALRRLKALGLVTQEGKLIRIIVPQLH